MDISPEYILMCEKAEEIQKQWKPQGGDWYLHDYRGSTKTTREFETQIWGDEDKTWQRVEILCYRPSESQNVLVSTDGEQSFCTSVAEQVRAHCIWLPRQDQLQAMFGDYLTCKNHIYSAGYNDNEYAMYFGESSSYWDKFSTFEQLWLAFVMKEKYGKCWNGTDWEGGK